MLKSWLILWKSERRLFPGKSLWITENPPTFFSTDKILHFQAFDPLFHIFFPYCLLLLKNIIFLSV